MSEKRRPIKLIGNWKMHKTLGETTRFIHDLLRIFTIPENFLSLAVPFTSIYAAAMVADGSRVRIGAQNMHEENEGAFTGEISARMLKDAGASFVILGHSERRHLFHESNHLINKKIKRALIEGLQPILCVGETTEERKQDRTQEILEMQLTKSLKDIPKEEASEIVIAYEPVWAIGTGNTASPEQAEEAHHLCREKIAELWGPELAEQIPILYGGSVKPDNILSLLEKSEIDGALVGGASLDVEIFSQLIYTSLHIQKI